MPSPIITSVTPAIGHSGGGTLIRIVGSNFQLPPPPPPTGIVPDALPTVRVFIGGVEARRVRVASSTVLYVTTERRDPAKNLAVEVRNVGVFGETIDSPGTLVSAYEYARPIFTNVSELERLTKTLMAELRRQVFPEVVITAHVDWTDDPASILNGVRDAKAPCVLLAGPVLRPNNMYRTMVKSVASIAPDVVREHRAALTDDLVFTVGALADKNSTMHSMVAALRDFKLRNPFLFVAREAGSSDMVKFELFWEGDLTVDSTNDSSNIRTATSTIVIVGVDTLCAPGFESDQATTAHPTLLNEVELETASRTV